ncbi:MAG: sugar transporter substrate-binding protein [Subtercola sp.]|nr:sugar transporter substrate-binding protein [Subtercola sp.]
MKIKILLAGAVTVLVATAVAGCSGGAPSGSSSTPGSLAGTTITYWASNQGASIDADTKTLAPEIAKFTAQTGINVKYEVVPYPDLTNNTLSAAVSGQGPDVLNLGSTNASSFRATGAFYEWTDAALAEVGGKDHFIPAAFATTGTADQVPTSLPLYATVYSLFYNKQMFADAGLQPPTTWEEMVSDAKTLTKPAQGIYGLTIPGGTVNVGMHLSFILGSQSGGAPFDDAGNPTFTDNGMVDGVSRYVDLIGTDKVVNPSDAQYTQGNQSATAFANGKAAMMFQQSTGGTVLATNGMTEDKWGVVPIPAPQGGQKISSFIGGANIAIMKSSKNIDASVQFVKFMTSTDEQGILSKAFTSLPVVNGATADFTTDTAKIAVFQDILANETKPAPLVPGFQAFQTNVGGAVVALIAQAATGTDPTKSDVTSALNDAQAKMNG